MTSVTRRRFAIGTAAGLAAPWVRRAGAADPLRLRCSLDTAPSHGRNVAIGDFLKKLEAATEGQIKTELFSSGQLYPDLEVGKALIQGQVEMAAPGSWTITGIVPDADAFQLPVLYGRTMDENHRVSDGSAGKHIGEQINSRLRSHVVGPWLDLGFNAWYTTKTPLTSLAVLNGLKVRNSGGAGQAWRAHFFNALPITASWPSVPLALSQGTFDGLASTNESLASAQLWEAGVRFALEDRQFMGFYIPMISLTFWNKLAPAQQETVTRLWGENIATYRQNMAAAQAKARETLQGHGVTYTVPTDAELAAIRQKMMGELDAVVKLTKVSPETLKLVLADVG